MKRRKIQDIVSLLTKQVISLIKTLSEKFGTPIRERFLRRPGYTHFCRFQFTWNLSNVNMKTWGQPPHISIRILNNVVFKKGSTNPASKKLYKKSSKVSFFGYNGKAYEKYCGIMNQI